MHTRDLTILIAATLTLLAPLVVYAAGPDADAVASAISYARTQLEAARVPGAALAVVHGDTVAALEGFGVSDSLGTPVTPTTPFIIGSLTKSFTALAMMQLVEEGKVRLDAPVLEYVPFFRIADAAASRQITVREVLNQTTGISWRSGLGFEGSRDTRPDAIERRVGALGTVALTAAPGESFQYSNANYSIAGAIIEAVTGEPYERYIQERIFAPLQMRKSFGTRNDALPNGLSTGYRYWFGWPVPDLDLPYGRSDVASYLLISCAEDMAHYVIAHANGGRYESAQVLSPVGIEELHRGVAPTPYGDAYGMGWFDERWNGVRVLNHYGSFVGFHANMMIAPESGWGLVLLTNAESYACNTRRWAIAKNAFRILLGQNPAEPPFASADCIAFWSFPVILALLAMGVVSTARLARRWVRHPKLQPSGRQAILRHGLLPTAVYLGIAIALIVGVPRAFDAILSVILLTTPDAGWMIIIGSGLALGLAVARTALALWAMRNAPGSAGC